MTKCTPTLITPIIQDPETIQSHLVRFYVSQKRNKIIFLVDQRGEKQKVKMTGQASSQIRFLEC